MTAHASPRRSETDAGTMRQLHWKTPRAACIGAELTASCCVPIPCTRSQIPFLHIADPVGEAARQSKASVLGLLGTRYTMEQTFLRERLERQYGVKVLVPDETERAEVHQIIYEELCAGVIRDSSRKTCQSIIHSLARRGADAVILGCTEITLLIGQDDSQLPLLDTTALHARAAVNFALGEC